MRLGLHLIDAIAAIAAAWSIYSGIQGSPSEHSLILGMVCACWWLGRWSFWAWARSTRLLANSARKLHGTEAYFLRTLVVLTSVMFIVLVALFMPKY